MKLKLFLIMIGATFLMTGCGVTDETESTLDSSFTVMTGASSETVTTSANTTSEKVATEDVTESAVCTTETASKADEIATETTAEMCGTSDADFATIAGDWFIDGDPSLEYMHIGADGSFSTYTSSGDLENEGSIRYESEEIGGTIVYWYSLYSSDNEFVMGFVDDGSSYKTDIYIGNGAYPHYSRVSFAGGLDDDGRGPDE